MTLRGAHYRRHLRALSMRTVQHLTGASPVSKPATLSFSINGGELQTTDVHLPQAGVYPWVSLSGDSDEVTMTVTKLSGSDL